MSITSQLTYHILLALSSAAYNPLRCESLAPLTLLSNSDLKGHLAFFCHLSWGQCVISIGLIQIFQNTMILNLTVKSSKNPFMYIVYKIDCVIPVCGHHKLLSQSIRNQAGIRSHSIKCTMLLINLTPGLFNIRKTR